MQLTLTITDNAAGTRLVEDFCVQTQYNPASGITKADWVKQKLSEYLKRQAYMGEVGANSATIKTQINAIAIT